MPPSVRRPLDALLAGIARVAVKVFFREIEVVGAERLATSRGPLLIVANHENNLVDPLLLMAFSGRRPRILAKNTLWSHPVVAPFLVLAGAFPVYRHQDAAGEVARNFETFARCCEVLAAGGAVALFPEGRSHNEPRRLPLKSGAARVALEAEAKHGPLGLRIVPVGLTYEDKQRFRSRVLMRVGDPIDPAPEVREYAIHGRAAARNLTERIALGLETVTVNYASWEEARLIDRAVSLATTAVLPLSGRWPHWKGFVRRHAALRLKDPSRAAALIAALTRYEEERQAAGLSDAEVAAGHGRSSTAATLGRVAQGLLESPAALVGMLLNGLPFKLTGQVARRHTLTPDQPATYKIMTALIAFPAFWVLQAVVVGLLAGPGWGAVVLAAAPVFGYSTLLFRERRFMPLLRRLRRPSQRLREDLQAQRAALQREILEIIGGTGPSGTGVSGGYPTIPLPSTTVT